VSPNWMLLNSKSQSFTSNNNPHKNEKFVISLILKTSKSQTRSQWTPQLTPNLDDLSLDAKMYFMPC